MTLVERLEIWGKDSDGNWGHWDHPSTMAICRDLRRSPFSLMFARSSPGIIHPSGFVRIRCIGQTFLTNRLNLG